MKKGIIAILFFCLLLGVGIFVYLGQRNVQLRELYYSGTIESVNAELGFLVSGRVTDIPVKEGQFVNQGQLLAVLYQSEYIARYERARANMERAVNNLEKSEMVLRLYRKTLPDDVARAEAGVRVLQSQLKELKAGYRNQDIEKARLALLTSKDVMIEAKKDRDRYKKLFQEGVVSEKQWDNMKLQYETAVKNFERAKETLELLKEGMRKETIQTAQARLEEGEALLKLALNNLDKVGPAESDVQAAKAQVQVAKAESDIAGIQLEYTKLLSPFKGVITSKNIETGEIVIPGKEILTLSDLSTVELKIFVDETEIGKVRPGQPVDVKIDTFPEKIYKGTVSFISSEGEFTPKIIQTHKERVKLVYLVKVLIPNPHLELKSGMPADAWLK